MGCDAFAGTSERQKAGSVPVKIIEQIAAAQKNRATSGLRLNKPDRAVLFLFIKKSYGRGTGVGRNRGVGVGLGAGVAVGVGVTVAVGVAVTVAVDVGVGVGLA